MSRAVIDQAGFRVVFIGFLLSLVLGLILRAQIAPNRVRSIIQDSVSRLDKDFIIDFGSAEVSLSNWGLPLPSLQISNIRVSPKKSICQDSQIFIENLTLPISVMSLVTSESLITTINASHVELRIADFNHCFEDEKKVSAKPASLDKANDNHFISGGTGNQSDNVKSAPQAVESTVPAASQSIFQAKTAALLQRINIDELKLIYKKYPTQSMDFRHLTFDLGYDRDQLNQIDINSQIYALKDSQSDLMYFKGDLGVQISSNKARQVETVFKLNGHLLDGQIHFFALMNSLEKSVKMDVQVTKVALKPLVQLKLIESSFLNFPMTVDFRGYGFYHLDTNQFAELKLNDIEISGEKTKITLDDLVAKTEKGTLQFQPFKADVQKLNLNKIINLSQNKNVAQSIENLGEFTGTIQYKSQDRINLDGGWSDLEFIFANRGYRELQKIDSFNVQASLDRKDLEAKLSHFKINQVELNGQSEFSYNTETNQVEAKADLGGVILNDRVWNLLTQHSQTPNIKIHWNYKKTKEERHQLNMDINQVEASGLKFDDVNFNFIQTLQDGISSSAVVGLKVNKVRMTADQVRINLLKELFNPQSEYPDNTYVAENLRVNLKGTDWRAMGFEVESHLKSIETASEKEVLKPLGTLKVKGDWGENDFVAGQLTIQHANKSSRFQLIKNQNNDIGIAPL